MPSPAPAMAPILVPSQPHITPNPPSPRLGWGRGPARGVPGRLLQTEPRLSERLAQGVGRKGSICSWGPMAAAARGGLQPGSSRTFLASWDMGDPSASLEKWGTSVPKSPGSTRGWQQSLLLPLQHGMPGSSGEPGGGAGWEQASRLVRAGEAGKPQPEHHAASWRCLCSFACRNAQGKFVALPVLNNPSPLTCLKKPLPVENTFLAANVTASLLKCPAAGKEPGRQEPGAQAELR